MVSACRKAYNCDWRRSLASLPRGWAKEPRHRKALTLTGVTWAHCLWLVSHWSMERIQHEASLRVLAVFESWLSCRTRRQLTYCCAGSCWATTCPYVLGREGSTRKKLERGHEWLQTCVRKLHKARLCVCVCLFGRSQTCWSPQRDGVAFCLQKCGHLVSVFFWDGPTRSTSKARATPPSDGVCWELCLDNIYKMKNRQPRGMASTPCLRGLVSGGRNSYHWQAKVLRVWRELKESQNNLNTFINQSWMWGSPAYHVISLQRIDIKLGCRLCWVGVMFPQAMNLYLNLLWPLEL